MGLKRLNRRLPRTSISFYLCFDNQNEVRFSDWKQKPFHPRLDFVIPRDRCALDTQTKAAALCFFFGQGCYRDDPPLRILWTRWCLSSVWTLRLSSWTLRAEGCPPPHMAAGTKTWTILRASLLCTWLVCIFIYRLSLLKSHWLIWHIFVYFC